MRAFFCNYDTNEDVPQDAPVELDFLSARRHFFRFRSTGCFLGLELSPKEVLQFMINDDKLVRVEIVHSAEHRLESCVVTHAIAEEILKMAFEGHGYSKIVEVIKDYLIKWNHESY